MEKKAKGTGGSTVRLAGSVCAIKVEPAGKHVSINLQLIMAPGDAVRLVTQVADEAEYIRRGRRAR